MDTAIKYAVGNYNTPNDVDNTTGGGIRNKLT